MKKQFVAAIVALALAGCVSMGTNYDVAAVDRIAGETRKRIRKHGAYGVSLLFLWTPAGP